jgi:hypothetical protein
MKRIRYSFLSRPTFGAILLALLCILIHSVAIAATDDAFWDSRFISHGPSGPVTALVSDGSNIYCGGSKHMFVRFGQT